jgi:hypothetical protein
MSNFKNDIDKLVSRILNEEIENKVKQISEEMHEGDWTEIEMGEELHGGQKKLDVAKPKGKITAADFEELRNKKEVDEFYFDSEEDEEEDDSYFDFDGDDSEDEEMEMGRDEFHVTRKPKTMGSFDDEMEMGRDKFHVTRRPTMTGSFDDEHGFFDQDNIQYTGDFDFDYDEEEFDDFDSFDSKYSGKQAMFAPGEEGRKFFDMYKEKFGKPFRVRTPRDMEEAETEEGNKFTKALDDAREDGDDTFEVDGKTYNVRKESRKSSLRLTEDELIDMIEKIVLEQKVKDSAEGANISKKSPVGLKKTEDVLGKNKKENDDYAKEVVEKMKDYMKDMVSGGKGYDANPEDFPQSNYDMEKEHNEMKYHPSDAVEEYIEAFAYPGMTNLVYDEIKPDEEMIEKQIKGDSKNGNAVTGKDGKALGNVSKRSEKTGERFKKNFEENLYGAEQMEVSYNRQPQPVDVAGSKKQAGSLKSIRNTSKEKAGKIMSQLESTETKQSRIISEEMNKMKNLISYNRKTQ